MHFAYIIITYIIIFEYFVSKIHVLYARHIQRGKSRLFMENYAYTYTDEYWPDYDAGSRIEWYIANEYGCYGGGSLIGSLSRTNHGYLSACLSSPAERYIVLDQITEQVCVEGKIYDLEASRHLIDNRTISKNGQEYLTKVIYDGTIQFQYECGELTHVSEEGESTIIPAFAYAKTIALSNKDNTAVISYDMCNNSDLEATIALTPLLNFRKNNTLTDTELPKFREQRTGRTLSLVPRTNLNTRIDFSVSEGTFVQKIKKIDFNSQLSCERGAMMSNICSHYTPYQIDISIPPNTTKTVSVMCHVEYNEWIEGDALLQQVGDLFIPGNYSRKIISDVRTQTRNSVKKSGLQDEFAAKLVLAANSFITYTSANGRATAMAGFPYLSDQSRETLISFTGLTLCTKRYEDARSILKSYTKLLNSGLLPDRIPNIKERPEYNSVDISLWYFIATYEFLTHLRDDLNVNESFLTKSVNFINNEVFPVLANIIDTFEHNAATNIYVLDNGLLHTGTSSSQMTWMNSRNEEGYYVQRHGCSVEINALWYNALCIMDYLCKVLGYDDGGHYTKLASQVKSSFIKVFWDSSRHYLHDVVEFDLESKEIIYIDSSIRPNQIFAVSLPFSLLSIREEKSVVSVVERNLYVGNGIRTLNTSNQNYIGSVSDYNKEEKQAYHCGYACSYLLGSFFTAYRKVNGPGSDTTEKLRILFSPIQHHLIDEDCVGGVSEFFEGDDPHLPRGCYTYAPAIAELLRAYVDVFLKNTR